MLADEMATRPGARNIAIRRERLSLREFVCRLSRDLTLCHIVVRT